MKEPKINLIQIDEMKENEFMMFDINTGSAVLVRDGKVVANKTISKADIQKAKETYLNESSHGVRSGESKKGTRDST